MVFDMNTFGERLRDRRRERGYTQSVLGDLIGLGGGSISQWERGLLVPQAEHLYNLCETLSISADVLLGLRSQGRTDIEEANGLRWRVISPYSPADDISQEIKNGIDIYRLIVCEQMGLADIQRLSKFSNLSVLKLQHFVQVALYSRAVEIVGVERDIERETRLLEAYAPHLRHCVVCKVQLPTDRLVDATVRKESVAFLAARTAIQALPDHGTVGLTGGTTLARFVDLVPPNLSKLAGITWVPLLAAKPTDRINPGSASDVVARMVYNQPGSQGYNLPFLRSEQRGLDYINRATGVERTILEQARSVMERAETVSDALISVASSDFGFRSTDGSDMGRPFLKDLVDRMPRDRWERCAGDVLLHLIDDEGKQIGDESDELQRANDDMVYSISLDTLRQIGQQGGTIWVLAARKSKARAVRGAIIADLANCLVIESNVADVLLSRPPLAAQ
jgi:DNA-binding transcriptional regulator LsrR (DeoR family)/DNA-binding XRE family transcriptional regulator